MQEFQRPLAVSLDHDVARKPRFETVREFYRRRPDETEERFVERMDRIKDEYERRGFTMTRRVPSIGRNDPCPCRSGRKFKKCCLNTVKD